MDDLTQHPGKAQYEGLPAQTQRYLWLVEQGIMTQRAAYKEVGYKGESAGAPSRILAQYPEAREYLRALLRVKMEDELEASKRRLQNRARGSFADLEELIMEDGSLDLSRWRDLPPGAKALVSKLTVTEGRGGSTTVKIELHAPHPAEVQLGKIGSWEAPAKVEVITESDVAKALGMDVEDIKNAK